MNVYRATGNKVTIIFTLTGGLEKGQQPLRDYKGVSKIGQRNSPKTLESVGVHGKCIMERNA